VKLGALTLSSNLWLAPLAGWTSSPFRAAVRAIGGVGLAVTEVVSARALAQGAEKTLAYLERLPGDQPLAVQFNARTPEEARDAARYVEARGFEAVDFNLGCPVRKVARKGGGAALGRDADAVAEVVGAAVEACSIPVTAKLRLGWSEGSLTAPQVASALAKVGVAAVCVHGRTREQVFAGSVCADGIRSVVEAAPTIPVIANGDVLTPQGAADMLARTGAAGVMIGRGAIENPWIFRQTLAHLRGDPAPRLPSLAERRAFLQAHYTGLCALVGDRRGTLQFRKVLKACLRSLGAPEELLPRAVRIEGLPDLLLILRALTEESLNPPPPGGLVPTPKRPVDHW
jgi:nifR3 family TIM-barrel protein